MKSSIVALVMTALAALGGASQACSADGDPSAPTDEPLDAAPPTEDAPATLLSDGSMEAAPCDDCAFFLPICAPKSFCPVDVGVAANTLLGGLAGTSEMDVWAAGVKGTVLHYDGAEWSKVEGPDAPLTQIWPRSETDVVTASTLSLVFARTASSDGGADAGGTGWSKARLNPAPATDAHVHGLWSAPDSTWTWIALAAAPYEEYPTGLGLRRIRKGTIGTNYQYQTPIACEYDCTALMHVHGSSKDDLWAVGELGSAYRVSAADTAKPAHVAYDSRTYATLHGVWVADNDDVWTVGTSGVLRHYTGSEDHRFEIVASPVKSTLRSVWGSSKTDVWAVGDAGVVLHYDGTAWTRIPIGGVNGEPDLYAVWAASASRVWAVGQGVLLTLSLDGAVPDRGVK